MRHCLLALLLVACAEDPAPPVAPPAPGTDEASEAEPEATPEGTAEPAPDEPAPDELAVPSDGPSAEAEETIYVILSELDSDGRIGHPDPHVARVLEGIFVELARRSNIAGLAQADDDYDPEDQDQYDTDAGGGCTVRLLHEHLISISCGDHFSSRSDVSSHLVTYHFSIVDGEVRPLDPLDLFEPREAVASRMRAHCLSEVASAEEEGMHLLHGASCDALVLILGEDRLTADFEREDYSLDEEFDVVLALDYEDLAEQIPAGGFLRALFADAEPPSPPPAAHPDATAVSRADLEHRLVAQWQALTPEARANIGMRRWSHGLAQLVWLGEHSEGSAAAATAVATRLGATPRRVRLESPVRPFAPTYATTTGDLNLRAHADGPVRLVLPAGAIVTRVDPRDRARFVEVLVPGARGVVARSVLRPFTGCVPGAPPGFDANTQPLTARTQLRRAGARVDAALFAARVGARQRVVVHELQAGGCELGPERLRLEVEGELRDARLTATTSNGGQSILVVGARTSPANEDEERAAYEATTGDVTWAETFELASRSRTGVRLGESVDGRYYPITLEVDGEVTRVAWTGSALEATSPE